jgi:hypothetical protein
VQSVMDGIERHWQQARPSTEYESALTKNSHKIRNIIISAFVKPRRTGFHWVGIIFG